MLASFITNNDALVWLLYVPASRVIRVRSRSQVPKYTVEQLRKFGVEAGEPPPCILVYEYLIAH